MGIRSLLRSLVDRVAQPYLERAQAQIAHQMKQWEARLIVELERNAVLAAQPRISELRNSAVLRQLSDAEFRVFSQFGEDGIIQYLIQRVPIQNETFIEFGVETYHEANTRFLLINNNWRGLILDADPMFGQSLIDNPLFWRHDLTAVSSYITAENIDAVINAAGFGGDIGLLSIDIDGNDYWVWQALTAVSPRVVVCEYNSLFGNRNAVVVPYDSNFDMTKAHHSNLFFGASLPALCHLATTKGYVFVGSNSTGHNAFFVRADVADGLPQPTIESEYRRSRFRSSAGADGKLTFLSGEARSAAIGHLEVLDVLTRAKRRVSELE
jgi:hypothetical protein